MVFAWSILASNFSTSSIRAFCFDSGGIGILNELILSQDVLGSC